MILTIPWPHKDLGQNARVPWRTRHHLTALAKRDAFLLTRQLPESQRKPIVSARALRLTVTLFPPSGRVRADQTNILDRLKAAIDGICDCCRVDDSIIESTTVRWGDKLPGGCVRIELEAM